MDNKRFNEVVTAIRAGGGTVISPPGSLVRFFVGADSALPFELERAFGKPLHYEGEDTRLSPFAGTQIITKKIAGEWVEQKIPHAGFVRVRTFSMVL
jgi:hypothetical protein